MLNVIIVLSLNLYTLLTGGWITLLFQQIRFRDIELLLVVCTAYQSIMHVYRSINSSIRYDFINLIIVETVTLLFIIIIIIKENFLSVMQLK